MTPFQTGLPSPVLAFPNERTIWLQTGHQALGQKKKNHTEMKNVVKTPLTNNDSIVMSN